MKPQYKYMLKPAFPGLMVLLGLIAVQGILVSNWVARRPAGLYNGDEFDYAEKARLIQNHQLFIEKNTYSKETETYSDKPNSDWRPIGYPAMVALVTWPSVDANGAREKLTLLQYGLNSICLILIYLILLIRFTNRNHGLMTGTLLGIQPWAFGFVGNIAPEAFGATFTFLGLILLSVWVTTALTGRYGRELSPVIVLVSGTALLSATVTLRAECIVLVPPVIATAIWIRRRSYSLWLRAGIVTALVFTLLVGIQIWYRYELTGNWQIYGRVHFFNHGASQWMDTWMTTEKNSYDSFAFKLGDASAQITDLPERAFSTERERKEIEYALNLLHSRRHYDSQIDDIFMRLATERRLHNPFKNVILTRGWRTLQLWFNLETASHVLEAQSRLPRLFSRAIVFLYLSLKVFIFFLAGRAIVSSFKKWRRDSADIVDVLVILGTFYAVMRTLLMGLIWFSSVARYVHFAWLPVIFCAGAGLLAKATTARLNSDFRVTQ